MMKEKKEKEKEKKEEREFLPAGTRTDGPIKGSTRGPRRTKKEKEGKKLETLTSTPAHIVLKTKEKQFPPSLSLVTRSFSTLPLASLSRDGTGNVVYVSAL